MSQAKGQSSMEQLIAFVFILFILVMAALFATDQTRDSNKIKKEIDAKRICNSVADNINSIAEQGSGFYKYFSLPAVVAPDNQYTISINESSVEISLEDYAYVTQLITSNVSVECLDKGQSRKNKVFNEGERIYIICHKPELLFLNNSLSPKRAGTNQSINISIKIMNFGPVDSGPFNVSFNNTNISVAGLASEESRHITFNYTTNSTPGDYVLEFWIDPQDSVKESIERNNLYNETINVRKYA